MLFSLIKRELRGKYKASILGFLWTFLIPLFQWLVYTVVFSVVLKSDIDKFYLFLVVGLFPWNFFNTCITSGASCVVSQENLVKKIYFPRIVLPVAYVTSAFINMLISFVVIFIVLIVSGHGFNFLAVAYLPLVMLIEYILSLGLCMIVSALTVYFRDLEYIMGILSLAWMYLTPMFYQIDNVPDSIKIVFRINPMSTVVISFQQILYYKQIPEAATLLQSLVVGIVALFFGYFIFNKIQRRFVEEL
jgi:ABC-2 type transport system permease protein